MPRQDDEVRKTLRDATLDIMVAVAVFTIVMVTLILGTGLLTYIWMTSRQQ